jgi:hypothetical protein
VKELGSRLAGWVRAGWRMSGAQTTGPEHQGDAGPVRCRGLRVVRLVGFVPEFARPGLTHQGCGEFDFGYPLPTSIR